MSKGHKAQGNAQRAGTDEEALSDRFEWSVEWVIAQS